METRRKRLSGALHRPFPRFTLSGHSQARGKAINGSMTLHYTLTVRAGTHETWVPLPFPSSRLGADRRSASSFSVSNSLHVKTKTLYISEKCY